LSTHTNLTVELTDLIPIPKLTSCMSITSRLELRR